MQTLVQTLVQANYLAKTLVLQTLVGKPWMQPWCWKNPGAPQLIRGMHAVGQPIFLRLFSSMISLDLGTRGQTKSVIL